MPSLLSQSFFLLRALISMLLMFSCSFTQRLCKTNDVSHALLGNQRSLLGRRRLLMPFFQCRTQTNFGLQKQVALSQRSFKWGCKRLWFSERPGIVGSKNELKLSIGRFLNHPVTSNIFVQRNHLPICSSSAFKPFMRPFQKLLQRI